VTDDIYADIDALRRVEAELIQISKRIKSRLPDGRYGYMQTAFDRAGGASAEVGRAARDLAYSAREMNHNA
jgi:hypothetical protein